MHSRSLKLFRAIRFCTRTYIVNFLTPTDFGPLVNKNARKGELSRAPRRRKNSERFCKYFWDINFQLGMYIQEAASHIELEFSGSLCPTAKSVSKSFFFIYGLKIRESLQIVYTHLYSTCPDGTDFRHGWAYCAPVVSINTRKGGFSRAPCHR